VHILAAGARTPVGLSAESTAAAVRAAISRHGLHPFMVDQQGDEVRAAMDGRLDPKVLGWKRMEAFLRSACAEALTKVFREGPLAGPVLLLAALPETRPGFSEADARSLVGSLRDLAVGQSPVQIELAHRGHAGGLHAIELALQKITRREVELCLVGGVDSYLEARAIDWLQANRQLAAADVRSGFTPGEGAGVIVLGSDDARRRLRLPSLGLVRGIGTAVETKLIKTESVNLGQGLCQAMLKATRDLKPPAEVVDAVYCDINGERYRTEEWGFALLRGQRVLGTGQYVAPVDCWGDVGAASGPLLCNLAVQSWGRQYAQGPRALVWAGSEAGLRAAAVIEAPAGARGKTWQA
jgi:3-oxoacyl-[acyl-carrier-protein] synthase-1